jgi:hypothetical protein
VDTALWITTLSTLGLFLAATVAGFIAWRTFWTETERDRRAQAERIGAWTATRADSADSADSADRKPFGLCLLNDSSLPVTELEVLVPHGEDPAEPQRYQVLPPGFYFALSDWPDKPFGHFGRPEPMDPGTLELEPTTVHAGSPNVDYFSFVDATGQRWRRRLRAKPGEASLNRASTSPVPAASAAPSPSPSTRSKAGPRRLRQSYRGPGLRPGSAAGTGGGRSASLPGSPGYLSHPSAGPQISGLDRGRVS